MTVFESVRVALRALLANKLRAILTVLGIIIGVGAVIALISVGQGAQREITQNIQALGTNLLFIEPGARQQAGVRQQAGSFPTLTYEDALAIADEGDLPIVGVAPELGAYGQIIVNRLNWDTRITGTTPSYALVRNFQVADGQFLDQHALDARSRVIVLGPTVASNLFPDQDPVGQTVKISVHGRIGENFKVIGVTVPKGATGFGSEDDQVFIPLTTMQQRVYSQLTTRGLRNVEDINVKVASPTQMAQATAGIGQVLRQRHHVSQDDFTITSEDDILRFFSQVTSVFTLVLGAIAGISLVVGGIGIMNIMLVSVTERTREIGIRRAVGARRQDILVQFLVEAVVVSLVGGMIGVLLGVGIARVLSSVPVDGQYLQTVVSVNSVILAFGVSASIGLFFGFYPALRASRLHPIDALRYE
ncbi:MAG TPA: ABC transporter permease [Chloroflexota bacterium]|nr:ABC transporter permease [Chloroflexota bacterium]